MLSVISEARIFKWIPKDIKKGALHRSLGIPQDEKIPTKLLLKKKKELQEKAKTRKLSQRELRLLRRIGLALTFRKFK